jgi:hypothetical protein
VKIAFAPNRQGSGYCIDAGGYDRSDASPIATYQCTASGSIDSTQLYVRTKYGFFISAYATADQFEGGNQQRVYLGTCSYQNNSDANGKNVCLTYNNGIAWSLLPPP